MRGRVLMDLCFFCTTSLIQLPASVWGEILISPRHSGGGKKSPLGSRSINFPQAILCSGFKTQWIHKPHIVSKRCLHSILFSIHVLRWIVELAGGFEDGIRPWGETPDMTHKVVDPLYPSIYPPRITEVPQTWQGRWITLRPGSSGARQAPERKCFRMKTPQIFFLSSPPHVAF